jgi:hypothetical protein
MLARERLRMKRRINNQVDADKLRFIVVISSTCSGIIMPIIRGTEVNKQTAYVVKHWSCFVRLAEKRQVLVHFLVVKSRLCN